MGCCNSVPSDNLWCQHVVYQELAGQKLCQGILDLNERIPEDGRDNPIQLINPDIREPCFSQLLIEMINRGGICSNIANHLKNERAKLLQRENGSYTRNEYKQNLITFEKMC